jgi:hypothetical protein
MSGYHSSRRSVGEDILKSAILPLYDAMRDEEAKYPNPKDKAAAGLAFLENLMQTKATTYERYIFSLCQ